MKFQSKNELKKDYIVIPLEGLFWSQNKREFDIQDKNNWRWTIFIVQPNFVTEKLNDAASIRIKQKGEIEGFERLKFHTLTEGLSAQILYIGPYHDEGVTIEKLHQYIKENGYKFDASTQKHHEIFLTTPEELKTRN